MRWLSVYCRNFLSYEDLELDLTPLHMAAVVGKNGAGKSSLATETLTFALWGKGRARTLDKYIRDDADEATVGVGFASNGSEYQVSRTVFRSGRGNNITFLKNGADALAPKANKAQHTVDEIQSEINRVIGLDYDSMRAGPLMVQNDSDNLMALGPSRGMELLIGLFGASQYEPFGTEASKRSGAYNRDAQAAQAEVTRLLDILDGEDAANAALRSAKYDRSTAQLEREQLMTQVAGLNERLSVIREQAQHAETLRQTVTTVSQRIDSDKKEYERLLRQLSEAHQVKETPEPTFPELTLVEDDIIRRLSERYDGFRSDQTKRQVLEGKLPLLEQQLADMTRRASIVDTVPCHGEGVYATCRFLVDANKRDEIDALTASIEKARTDLVELPSDEDVAQAGARVDRARKAQAAGLAEQSRRTGLVAEWRLKVDHAKQFTANGSDATARLETQIERDQQVLLRASEQLKKLDVDPMTTSTIEMQIQQVKTDLTERDRMLQMVYEPAVRAAEIAVARIEDARRELPERQKAEKEASALASIYGVLAKAFHRDGIPALIVENGVPIIEERANEILSRMPDNYRIRLRTQRETKKGGMSDKLNIVVETNGVQRDYELLSGGERFRIDFALRIALARVLTNRSGTSIETLIIDEGFGSQDEDGVEAMLESLSVVQDEFGLVLVITHQPAVIQRFQTRLEVSRAEGGGSTVTLVQ